MSYATGAIYTGTKFAQRTLADCLREELRGDRVRVTSLHPGFVETEMGLSIRQATGRSGGGDDTYLQPEAIAEAVVYAISAPRSAHIESVTIRPILPPPAPASL